MIKERKKEEDSLQVTTNILGIGSSQSQQPTPTPSAATPHLDQSARWREIRQPAPAPGPTTPRQPARGPAHRRGTGSSATAPRRASMTCRRCSPACGRRARRAAPPTPRCSKSKSIRCFASGVRSSASLPPRPQSRHVPSNPSLPYTSPFVRDPLLLYCCFVSEWPFGAPQGSQGNHTGAPGPPSETLRLLQLAVAEEEDDATSKLADPRSPLPVPDSNQNIYEHQHGHGQDTWMSNPEQQGESAQQSLEHGMQGSCGEVAAANAVFDQVFDIFLNFLTNVLLATAKHAILDRM